MTLSQLKSLAPMLVAIAVLAAMALFVVFAPSPSKHTRGTMHVNESISRSMPSTAVRAVPQGQP